jgi:hypothetical protein
MNSYSLMSPSALSKSIREKKKKMMRSEPEMIGTSPTPDMDAQDIWDAEKAGQIEDTVDSPKKINADEAMLDDTYEQKPMSHEPMESHVNPKDHGRMAYGGEVEPHSDPMMPSEMDAEEVAGDRGTESEMGRRIGEGFQAGGMSSHGSEEAIGGVSDTESEMKRRTMARKMRLSAYLDSLDI